MSSVLPLYNHRGSPMPSRRSTFRLREKYFMLIGVFVFIGICYSAFVFLPEVADTSKAGIGRQVKNVFIEPGQFVIPPPNCPGHYRRRGNGGPAQTFMNIFTGQIGCLCFGLSHMESSLNYVIQFEQASSWTVCRAQNANILVHMGETIPAYKMMIFAWDGYAKFAWGANELRPVSKTGHSASIFGQSPLGSTIVDALDTLYIMGLKHRFDHGKKWVEMSMDLKHIRGDLSVFETNIRFIGGLLSCFAMTKDELFKRKAVEMANLLLPAFNTPTGIPYALINANTKAAKNWGWASAGASILSEFGSLHLEFDYLSVITGNPIYAEKIRRIREVLNSLEKPGGLYPNYLNPKTGKWGSRHTSVGALGDSFYEYLLKSWLVTNKRDLEGKRMYEAAITEIEKQLIYKSKSGMTYIAELRGSRLDHKMDHLACFSSGMFALDAANQENSTTREHYMALAKEVAYTCHESYVRTGTKLGPESFRFTNDFEAKTINDREKYYILRPEVIEGWFYLWRFTKESKYRQWAWDAAMAIENHCKAEAGYSGIRNVYVTQPSKDDVQQSFFLAETLKYLYLIFSDDDVLPLDKWVFNTEAHPLPVRVNEDEPQGHLPVDAIPNQKATIKFET